MNIYEAIYVAVIALCAHNIFFTVRRIIKREKQ